jgi:hypothetical protein
MPEKIPPKHRAYAAKREGQRVRWLEIGIASIHSEGCDLYIDRLPVGGFSGQIIVRGDGVKPDESDSGSSVS